MSLRLLSRPIWRTPFRYTLPSSRRISQSYKPPPFPTIPKCPSPTCSCAESPEMPEGFEIDHSKPLNGTMAAYAEQVLICTGKPDWPSRIEEENSGDNLAADIKELMGRGGTYSDVRSTIAHLFFSWSAINSVLYSLTITFPLQTHLFLLRLPHIGPRL